MKWVLYKLNIHSTKNIFGTVLTFNYSMANYIIRQMPETPASLKLCLAVVF